METGNKNALIAAGVIVIALIIYFVATNKTVNAPQSEEKETVISEINNSSAPPDQVKQQPKSVTLPVPAVTVAYNDDGYVTAFSPSIATINKGESVLFVNKSKRENMWVASDPYPQATIYPSFNQRKEVSVGGSYLFTFNERGKWRYHNQVNPARTGTVIVK